MQSMSEILVAAQILTPVILGVVGWLVKRAIAQIDRRQDEAERRIQKLEEDFVSKEDWLRESGILRQRLDRLSEDIAELKGQNQAGVEIGAAIAAALRRDGRPS